MVLHKTIAINPITQGPYQVNRHEILYEGINSEFCVGVSFYFLLICNIRDELNAGEFFKEVSKCNHAIYEQAPEEKKIFEQPNGTYDPSSLNSTNGNRAINPSITRMLETRGFDMIICPDSEGAEEIIILNSSKFQDKELFSGKGKNEKDWGYKYWESANGKIIYPDQHQQNLETLRDRLVETTSFWAKLDEAIKDENKETSGGASKTD